MGFKAKDIEWFAGLEENTGQSRQLNEVVRILEAEHGKEGIETEVVNAAFEEAGCADLIPRFRSEVAGYLSA